MDLLEKRKTFGGRRYLRGGGERFNKAIHSCTMCSKNVNAFEGSLDLKGEGSPCTVTRKNVVRIRGKKNHKWELRGNLWGDKVYKFNNRWGHTLIQWGLSL